MKLIATADPGLKDNGFWTVMQTLQCCGIGPEVPKEVRCADEQVLHGALLVGFGNFWIKGCSATCVCAFLHLPFQFPGSAGTVAPSEGFAVALRATGQWGAARRQDLRLTHTLGDADDPIESVAWAPDGRLAAGSRDKKVRVYDKAGSGGVGGWFLSYCATSLVLSCLPRCEEPCCCWPLTASNPLQNETDCYSGPWA